MAQTVFNLTTTGSRGEVIGMPSFLIADRGYAMDGQDAFGDLVAAVNLWFMDAPIEDARAEASYAGDEYNLGDMLSSGRVLEGLSGYGITALDGEIPAGGPYTIAEAVERHHDRLLRPGTIGRLWPEGERAGRRRRSGARSCTAIG